MSASFWGTLADRSSRLAMALAAAMAGLLGIAVLAALALTPALTQSIGFYAAVLFILNVSHAGVRIGRKTHVVDIGGGRKAEYVALSNSIIGVLLLVIGGLVSALMALGLELAIGVLSALALAGAAMALTMRHAQAD